MAKQTLDDAMKWVEKRRDEGNLRAYYYAFAPTGDPAIDLILAAVASAGKGYHHTDGWSDDSLGPSYIELIQEAADRAAKAGWIDAAEQSPDSDGWYWCHSKCPPQSYPQHAVRYRIEVDGSAQWLTSFPVTHWRTLPDNPNQ